MDSFAPRSLRGIAHMTRLRGAETVIVGIQPEVAFAMVQLGMSFEDVHDRARPRGGPGAAARGRGRRPATVADESASDRRSSPTPTSSRPASGRASWPAELELTSTDQTLLATAISEVARNITTYAGRGEVLLSVVRDDRGRAGSR